MPNDVAERTLRQSQCAVYLLTATTLHLNLLPESTNKCGQINPNPNDYHWDPIEIGTTFGLPDIPDWWWQQDEMHSKNVNLSNVAWDIFSVIPHAVKVEACLSLGRDVIGWRQSETTGVTLRKEVIVRQFAQANIGILAGNDPALDTMITENDSEMYWEAEETKLHRMAKAHNFLEMWQGSKN